MSKEYNLTKKIIESASNLVLKKIKKEFIISYKKGIHNLVTNVDKEVEEYITKEITSHFPNHTIIAEESGIKKGDLNNIWFIDPIDGTTNFAHKYPFFCISIAYSEKNEIKFGLIKNPITGELFSGIRGKGAQLNGKKIKVSKIKRLEQSLLTTGFPHDKKKSNVENFKKFETLTILSQGVRRDGAAALDLCYVACGRVDGFWETKLNPWDVAAGILIVEEAGGRITNFKGEQFNVFTDKIVATNGLVHKELLKYL